MVNGAIILLGLLLIGGGLWLSGAQPVGAQSLRELVRTVAKQHGVPPELAEAIVDVESGWDPKVVSLEDSYGLMQILCRPDGRGGCANRFDIVGWPPRHARDLFEAKLNVKIGMQILAYDISHFGLWRGVAAYNDWGARHDPPDGPYRNQPYVDWVRRVYQQLKGTAT